MTAVKWLTTLNDDGARKLPAAEDLIQQEVIVQELLVSTKRQFIDNIPFERVPDIKVSHCRS